MLKNSMFQQKSSGRKRLVVMMTLALFSICAIISYTSSSEPEPPYRQASAETTPGEEAVETLADSVASTANDAFANSPISIPRLLLSLFAVFLLIIVALPTLSKFMNRARRGSANGKLRVVESLPLGRQQYVCILDAPGKSLLLGVSDGSIKVLSEISNEGEDTAENSDFSEVLETESVRQHSHVTLTRGE